MMIIGSYVEIVIFSIENERRRRRENGRKFKLREQKCTTRNATNTNLFTIKHDAKAQPTTTAACSLRQQKHRALIAATMTTTTTTLMTLNNNEMRVFVFYFSREIKRIGRTLRVCVGSRDEHGIKDRRR